MRIAKIPGNRTEEKRRNKFNTMKNTQAKDLAKHGGRKLPLTGCSLFILLTLHIYIFTPIFTGNLSNRLLFRAGQAGIPALLPPPATTVKCLLPCTAACSNITAVVFW